MKIKHISGEEVDTDKLPDMEAMVIEKVEEFRLFCLDNKIPFLLFVDPKGTAKVGDLLVYILLIYYYNSRRKGNLLLLQFL